MEIRTRRVCPGIGRRSGGLPWQPAVEGMGGEGEGRRREGGGWEEERWQTQNYLAARLLASLVCAPLHMFYAYETRNVINRLAAAANSHCGKITGKPTQNVVLMSCKSTSEAEFRLFRVQLFFSYSMSQTFGHFLVISHLQTLIYFTFLS